MRHFIQNHQILNVWRAREEIVALMMYDVIFLTEQSNIPSLSDRVAAQIDNAWWQLF